MPIIVGGGGGASSDLYANIGIGSNGDESGSDTQWNISKLRPSPFAPDYSIQNAMCGPITFAAADPAIVFLNGPTQASLAGKTLTITTVEICVSNGAGTNKLIADGSNLVWGSTGYNQMTLSVSSIVEHIGADLSVSSGQIVSAAGGQFFVRVLVIGQLA